MYKILSKQQFAARTVVLYETRPRQSKPIAAASLKATAILTATRDTMAAEGGANIARGERAGLEGNLSERCFEETPQFPPTAHAATDAILGAAHDGRSDVNRECRGLERDRFRLPNQSGNPHVGHITIVRRPADRPTGRRSPNDGTGWGTGVPGSEMERKAGEVDQIRGIQPKAKLSARSARSATTSASALHTLYRISRYYASLFGAWRRACPGVFGRDWADIVRYLLREILARRRTLRPFDVWQPRPPVCPSGPRPPAIKITISAGRLRSNRVSRVEAQ